MREELSQKLIEKWPRIFVRNEYRPEEYRAGYVYPSVGDGWFDILDSACGLIESHLENLERAGYQVLDMRNSFDDAEKLEGEKVIWAVQAGQIKEKFGGLRFYVTGGDDYTSGVISMAESMSYRTCEHCGKPGSPRDDGWVTTLCDEHHEADVRYRAEKQHQLTLKLT